MQALIIFVTLTLITVSAGNLNYTCFNGCGDMTTNFELKTGGSGPGTGKYKVDLPACKKNFSSQSLVENNCDACFMVEINIVSMRKT